MLSPAPLLLAGDGRRRGMSSSRGRGRGATRSKVAPTPLSSSTMARELFPMLVVSVADFMALDDGIPLPSHQELLRRGKLVQMSEELAGRIIFVS